MMLPRLCPSPCSMTAPRRLHRYGSICYDEGMSDDDSPRRLRKEALSLSYFTIGYNIAEGVLSVLAGALSGSIALVGFGLDSFVESLSGGVMVWRFRRRSEMSEEEEERIEKTAARLVGITFFILAAYIVYESVTNLIRREIPDPSLPGILIAAVSFVVMPILFYRKYRVGKALDSRSLIADSKETLACMLLSGALLVGLGANYFLGWWQADPVAGLVIAIFLVREGYETLTDSD